MYGVLGEDKSDVDTLKAIIRKIAGNESISICGHGFDSASQMLKRGESVIRLLADLGCRWFIIAYDADGSDPHARWQDVYSRVVKPAGIESYCIVIPVQELEAWILADIEAVTKVFTGWCPTPIEYPEHIPKPKELLEKLSRDSKHRPRYSHATHNHRVAKYLDLEKVQQKCASIRPLINFVRGAKAA
ncbi:MAG: DUF4276 family protein [Planctomycetota bacterium]|nr:DUF4276 family protein [Planctomycetota bacterium]